MKTSFRFRVDQLLLPIIWAVGSFVIIAVVGEQLYLGLAIAVLGSIGLGAAALTHKNHEVD